MNLSDFNDQKEPKQRYKSKFDLLRAKTTRKSQIMRQIDEDQVVNKRSPTSSSIKNSFKCLFFGGKKKRDNGLPENSYLKDIISKTGVGLTPLILPLVQLGELNANDNSNQKYTQLEDTFKQVANESKLNYVYKKVKKRTRSKSPSSTPLLSFRRSSSTRTSKSTSKGDYDNTQPNKDTPQQHLYESTTKMTQNTNSNKKLLLKYSSSDSSRLDTFKTELDKTMLNLHETYSDFIPQSSSANTIPSKTQKTKELNKKKTKKQKNICIVDAGVNTEISMCNAVFTIKYDNSHDDLTSAKTKPLKSKLISTNNNVYGYLNDYDSPKRFEAAAATAAASLSTKPKPPPHQKRPLANVTQHDFNLITNRGRIEVPSRKHKLLVLEANSSASSMELPYATEIIRRKLEHELKTKYNAAAAAAETDLIYVNKQKQAELNNVQILLSLMPLTLSSSSSTSSNKTRAQQQSTNVYSPKLEILEEKQETTTSGANNFRQLYSKLMSPAMYESKNSHTLGYINSCQTPTTSTKRNSNDSYLTTTNENYDSCLFSRHQQQQQQYKIRYPHFTTKLSPKEKPISYTFNSDLDDDDFKIDFELNKIRQNVCNRLKFNANETCLKIA